MKVTPEHLAIIRGAIAPLDNETNRGHYRRGEFPRAELVKDLDKRYRWDLFYAARIMSIFDPSAAGYNDVHLDTALRAIVPPLERILP